MAARKKEQLAEPDVGGAKYVKRVLALLGRLHDDATARDRAGNRTLFHDPYAALVLFPMFSPAMDSRKKADRATWRMAYWFLAGLASEADLLAHVNRPHRTGVKLRAKDEGWGLPPWRVGSFCSFEVGCIRLHWVARAGFVLRRVAGRWQGWAGCGGVWLGGDDPSVPV